ncbi:secreted protein containing NADH:ubiquinone oxidoreductase, 30 kDa subunit domain protein, partial [mine drainage metagenome]
PPFSVFASEFVILSAGFSSGNVWAAVLLLIALAIVFAGLVGHLIHLLFGKAPHLRYRPGLYRGLRVHARGGGAHLPGGRHRPLPARSALGPPPQREPVGERMTTVPTEGEEVDPAPPTATAAPEADPQRRTRAEEEAALTQLGLRPRAWSAGEGLWWVSVPPGRWVSACEEMRSKLGLPLSTLFAEDAADRHGGLRVHAVFLGTDPSPGVHLACELEERPPRIPSLTGTIPYVTAFEREAAEMFGVEFEGATDLRPLLLHETHPHPPMRKGPPAAPSGVRSPYAFPPVEGEGVYEVPVGPVHAGVIEPGHFRFQVLG